MLGQVAQHQLLHGIGKFLTRPRLLPHDPPALIAQFNRQMMIDVREPGFDIGRISYLPQI